MSDTLHVWMASTAIIALSALMIASAYWHWAEQIVGK
jgi:hypothetical protein